MIVPVTQEDKAAVLALHRADPEAKKIWPSGIGQAWYWYWNSPAREEHWVKSVMEFGTLLGTVHWSVRLDGWRNLRDIAVHPSARGIGIGRELVEHIGLPIVLKTDHDSLANQFYLRLGFRLVQTVASRSGKKLFNEYRREAPWQSV